jgi:hypothetical protein
MSKKSKSIQVDCTPVYGDVAAFQVDVGPAGTGVVHLTVVDRDADQGQALITGALDRTGAVLLAAGLVDAVGFQSVANELAHTRAALEAIIRVCTGDTPGTEVDDLAQCANLADQGLNGEPLVGDPKVYKLSRIVVED